MTKKLHFLKSGTEQTAKAYSTTTESGSNYVTNVIDNTTCYIPIGSTSDSRATVGRVLKSGTTYAILSQAKPAYAEKSWTTAGTYTWTAPAGVTRVRVAVCGGGAGCAQAWEISGDSWSGAGGTSHFGNLITATGAASSYAYQRIDSENGDEYKCTVGAAGSPNGRKGQGKNRWGQGTTWPALSGGTGFALSFTLTNGSYGNGGGAISKRSSFHVVTTGSSGGYNSAYVSVTPGTTYTLVVGSGGSKSAGNGYYDVGLNGNSGFVLIAYGGDI